MLLISMSFLTVWQIIDVLDYSKNKSFK